MSDLRDVPIIQFGVGGVGRALLRQILETRAVVARRTGLRLRHFGLVEWKGYVADSNGLPDELLQAALALPRGESSLSGLPGAQPKAGHGEDRTLLDRLHQQGVRGAIVVDVTAAHGLEQLWLHATGLGYGVVLSNKRPLTASLETFRALEASGRLRHECTVGAALPVISTLRTLLDTGDEVLSIEGCFSGTLGYLTSALDDGMPFSSAVAEAKRLGYTEPDPREDLGGVDVARKALILGRMLGWPLNFEDIALESLYPARMAALTVDEFLQATSELDAEYAQRAQDAQNRGLTLRYVAGLQDGHCRVGLREVSRQSLMGSLRGTDNIVVFRTRRYGDNQIVVAGPGAGLEVTAEGVMGDILDLAREMVYNFP